MERDYFVPFNYIMICAECNLTGVCPISAVLVERVALEWRLALKQMFYEARR